MEATCCEALYNTGLVHKQMRRYIHCTWTSMHCKFSYVHVYEDTSMYIVHVLCTYIYIRNMCMYVCMDSFSFKIRK